MKIKWTREHPGGTTLQAVTPRGLQVTIEKWAYDYRLRIHSRDTYITLARRRQRDCRRIAEVIIETLHHNQY